FEVFFFSSRRRHTRFSRDWSSDVCSSDLVLGLVALALALVGLDGGDGVPVPLGRGVRREEEGHLLRTSGPLSGRNLLPEPQPCLGRGLVVPAGTVVRQAIAVDEQDAAGDHRPHCLVLRRGFRSRCDGVGEGHQAIPARASSSSSNSSVASSASPASSATASAAASRSPPSSLSSASIGEPEKLSA